VSEWDAEAIADYWKVAEENWYRYFVTVGKEPEKEVDVMEWRRYERAAGFIAAFRGTNATGGFGGWITEGRKRVAIKGRMQWTGPVESEGELKCLWSSARAAGARHRTARSAGIAAPSGRIRPRNEAALAVQVRPRLGGARALPHRDRLCLRPLPAVASATAAGERTGMRKDNWFPPPRTVRGGHRVADTEGRPPIETREYPFWWWPFELAARMQARLAKYLNDELRAGFRETDRRHP
jgi:hypothetical protein